MNEQQQINQLRAEINQLRKTMWSVTATIIFLMISVGCLWIQVMA